MQQVKLFKGIETDLNGLESEINQWLRESDARIVQMFGNIAPQTAGSRRVEGTRGFEASDVFLAVVYERR